MGCGQSDDSADGTIESNPLAAAEAEAEPAAQWLEPEDTTPGLGGSCGNVRPSTNCSAPLAPGDDRVCRIGGRSYTLHAGRSFKPCEPVAVVFDLPSSLNTAASTLGKERFCLGTLCWNAIGSGWVAESDAPSGGFIVVSPERAGLQFGDEQMFYRDIVAELRRVANVDLRKVYVTGASDGGRQAQQTACAQSATYAGVSATAGGDLCANVQRGIPSISFSAQADLTHMANLAGAEAMARANGCSRTANTWRVFDARTPDPICRSANGDPRAQLVPCSQLRGQLAPTTCRVWDRCRDGVKVVFCDVPPTNPHGMLYAATDAHVIYENATQLNLPSVAWRFFQEFNR